MSTTTEDAQGAEEESKLSYEEQLAQIKQNSDEEAARSGQEADVDEDGTTEDTDDAEVTEGQDTEGTEDDSTEGTEASEDADEDTDVDEDQQYKGRFTQFAGDGSVETYIKNLEDGYTNSSQEAIRIKDERDAYEAQVERVKKAAAQDKDLGERLLNILKGDGAGGSTQGSGGDTKASGSGDSENPFLKDAETRWNEQSEKEAEEFSQANPEVVTDPKINADVRRWMRVFSNEVYEREGRLMMAGEAMRLAYRHLGLEDKTQSKQNLVAGLKKQATPPRPQSSKKGNGSSDSKKISDLTLSIASQMGIDKTRIEKGLKRK